jgi:hypothetical protein
MATTRKHLKHIQQEGYKSNEQIALATKQGLVLVISILVAILVALVFKIGGYFWPRWLLEYRESLIGFFLFITIFLTLFSPVIIEYNRNPRHFSGPGKYPGQGWGK